MIEFACGGCGKTFRVDDGAAGRKGRCKQCGADIAVPVPAAPPPPPAPEAPPRPKKPPMRDRRLAADAERMRKLFAAFAPIRIREMRGDPPDYYKLEYRVRGVARGAEGKPVYRSRHEVEITLTADYPRQSPKCRILTPIFHPNFDPTSICVGDHWTAAERLSDLVVRIGEMIAYQAYNIKSPLDGEAAMWADLNAQRLPTDARDLAPPET